MKPYMEDYEGSFLGERTPGTPVKRGVEVHNVSDELGYGGGALLMTSGVPDFVLTPEGFQHVPAIKKLGISDRERCDVVTVTKGAPKGAPPCPICHDTAGYVQTWRVKHRRTDVEFLLLDCSCKNVSWTGPVAVPGSEADRG